jgi:hypothetical protein
MTSGLHAKYRYSRPILMKPEFSGQFFEKKTQIPNFIKICPVRVELFHADRIMEGQTRQS